MPENEAFFRQILDESSDPIFSFYPDGTYRYVNKAFAAGVGRSVSALIGHRIWDVFPQDEADKRFAAVKQAFATGEDRVIEVKVVVEDNVSWYLTTVRPVLHPDGTVATVVCVSKNITDRKRAEQQLEHFATTDDLTGVSNRRTGMAILNKLLDLTRRSGAAFTLLYADINHLKKVNDTWGHAAGDQLIVACCQAICRSVRQADTVCRMGGDEFLVLLPDCDERLAGTIEQRINEQLGQFNGQGNHPWKAGLSIGLLGYHAEGPDTADALLSTLDERMYANKPSQRR